jgi:outer membrane protein assembly factor BamA
LLSLNIIGKCDFLNICQKPYFALSLGNLIEKINKVAAIFVPFFLCLQTIHSSVGPADSLRGKRHIVSGLPVLFYTPETRFGFGATGLFLFNFKNDSLGATKSSINLSFIYTQNKQILLSLPFNLFVGNRTWQLYGELGFNRYHFNFYGVGNKNPVDYVERYGVEFPRVRLTAIRKIFPHFYAGLRYAYDEFRLYDLEENGKLITGTIPGSQGGTVSGLGCVLMYDNRDNVYYPSKGWWSELVFFHDDPATGSSFLYNRIAFDVAKYFSVGKNIVALNAYSLYSDADLPFFQMAILGGQKKMRGFYEGRYRDNNALIFQAEYRRHLFWLLGVTVFADMGQVAKRYDRFNSLNWKYTYGAGLRLTADKTQKINLRFDIAVGNNKILPYFTVGEAF